MFEINEIKRIDGGIEINIAGFGPWGIQDSQTDTLTRADFPVWEIWCTEQWTDEAIKSLRGGAA